jgi:large subunit ribosomal protein L23
MKPIVTEKAVLAIERDNTLTFQTEMKRTKEALRKDIQDLFEVKIEKIRTSIKNNKKYVFVKLKKEFPAIDIATKLGLI